jgi:nucleotide-binding universal stress UspA family protein
MIHRVLLAVDDSADSLAAARLAVDLAARHGHLLRAVHVSADGALDEALRTASARPGVGTRRGRSEAAVLARVQRLAEEAGATVEVALLHGEVARVLLEEARRFGADLVVVGKSTRATYGEPYVGTVTRHVLEFSEQPVLVVPPLPHRGRPDGGERRR